MAFFNVAALDLDGALTSGDRLPPEALEAIDQGRRAGWWSFSPTTSTREWLASSFGRHRARVLRRDNAFRVGSTSNTISSGRLFRWLASTIADKDLAAQMAAWEDELLAHRAADLERIRHELVQAVRKRYLDARRRPIETTMEPVGRSQRGKRRNALGGDARAVHAGITSLSALKDQTWKR